MSRWFRWHQGTTEDGKFRVTARNASVTVSNGCVTASVTVRDVIALWALLLENAASVTHNGIVTVDVAWMTTILDFDPGVVEHILSAMQEQGLIREEEDQIIVCNWEKRQFKTDGKDSTNAERQRRFRERHRNGVTDTRNGSVTAGKRMRNGKSNGEAVTHNGSVTPTEYREHRTEKKDSCSNEFERFWQAYPRKEGKKAAYKAFDKALKEISAETILAALERQKPQWRDPQFIPHPATWLNRGQWADELPIAPTAPMYR